MFRYYVIIAVTFLIQSTVFSQVKEIEKAIEPIATDRPDQTETPSLVPKGMFQMENGFSFEKTNDDVESIVSPTILFKYGINENFELRLIAEYITDKTDFDEISRMSPLLVGLKVKLAEEKGIIPKTSLIAHMTIPFLTTDRYNSDGYAPEFRFTMQHTLSDKINLGYNLGAEWDGESPEPTFIYTLTTGISLTEKAGLFLEVYGFAPEKDKADHRFDAGFTYLLSNNFMLDISGGAGITDNAPDYFGSLGFSFRLETQSDNKTL